MKWKFGDHVRRNVGNTFWDGIVLTNFRTLSGTVMTIVERPDHHHFMCTPDKLGSADANPIHEGSSLPEYSHQQ